MKSAHVESTVAAVVVVATAVAAEATAVAVAVAVVEATAVVAAAVAVAVDARAGNRRRASGRCFVGKLMALEKRLCVGSPLTAVSLSVLEEAATRRPSTYRTRMDAASGPRRHTHSPTCSRCKSR